MPTMPEHSKYADKHQQHRKVFYLLVCVLTVVLSIAGITIAGTDVNASRDIYIAILVFSLICLMVELTFRLLRKSGAQSKYEVSERKEESSEKKVEKKETSAAVTNGVENKGFDVEKADPTDEKWVKNYVPYGDNPDGKAAGIDDTVTVESDNGVTGEEKRREEEKGEKENKKEGEEKDEKWKENYVPHSEEEKE